MNVNEKGYSLGTVLRAEIPARPERLAAFLNALNQAQEPVVFPVHPRTRQRLEAVSYAPASYVRLVEPVGYLDMVRLQESARMILTDSGGVQKEAYWLGVPCVTMRDETEWVETVEAGGNCLAGADTQRILEAVRAFHPPAARPPLFGAGAAQRIVKILSLADCGLQIAEG